MPQLLIQIIDAQNIADTEIIGKQDPYVVIRTDCDRQETFVCKDGGRNPHWNVEKTVSYNDPNSNIQFFIVNKNFLKDNNIGTVTYPLSTLLASGGFVDAFLPVISLNRQKGTLHITIRCINQYGVPPAPTPVPAVVPVVVPVHPHGPHHPPPGPHGPHHPPPPGPPGPPGPHYPPPPGPHGPPGPHYPPPPGPHHMGPHGPPHRF